MRWNAPPPLIGSWGGSPTGAGVKDMVKDVAKGVGGGVKETFTKASPSELPHGIRSLRKRVTSQTCHFANCQFANVLGRFANASQSIRKREKRITLLLIIINDELIA